MWDPNLNPPRIITTSNNNNAHNPWWWYSRNVLSWVLSWIPAEGNLPVDFGASYHLLTSPPFQTSRRPTTLWATRVIICVVLLRDLGFSRPFITAGNPKNQTPHELFKGRAGPVRRHRNEASLRLHISSFLRPPARPHTPGWTNVDETQTWVGTPRPGEKAILRKGGTQRTALPSSTTLVVTPSVHWLDDRVRALTHS